MNKAKTYYQATIKFMVSKNEELKGWMYCESPNTFYETYDECLDSVKIEIARRSKTDQPITAYRIIKVTKEEIETIRL